MSSIFLDDLRGDLPYALRGLMRSRGFTAAAVITLGLGIGAATAVLSVVNTVLLEPLSYKDADRLVRIVERAAPANPSGVPSRNRDPATLLPTVRSLVNRVDSAAGIDAMLPMEQLVASSLTRQRFYAILLGTFAAIAAILGAIGIYGVLAYAVGQRTQEIGIRMALGAERGAVLRMVLRHGIALMTPGIGLGLAGAAGLARYLSGMLVDLTPLDPATYGAVGILFAAVALVASYLPARRATLIDPMVALRHD